MLTCLTTRTLGATDCVLLDWMDAKSTYAQERSFGVGVGRSIIEFKFYFISVSHLQPFLLWGI